MVELRRLLPYLRDHRRSLAVGLVCLLLTAAFAVASPWVLRHAVDDLALRVTRDKLYLYSGLILGLVLAEGLFRYQMRMILIGMSREIEYELRNDLFRHLTRLSARFYLSQRVGEIMSRATNDMAAVRMVLGPGIMYTANTVATFAGTVAVMATVSPRLLGLALVPLAMVSILVRVFGKRIHDRFDEVQAQLALMNAVVQENLAAARVVRAFVQEAHELRRFEEVNAEYFRRTRRLIRLFGSLYPGIQLLLGISAAGVLWLGGRMVVAGSMSLGQFVAFTAYLAMLHWPMIALGWVVNLFERGEASMGRIGALLDAPADIRDDAPEAVDGLRGDVEFRDLDFSYDGRPVLKGIRLRVAAGQTVAVVGPTGSGKSTLVSLLVRLHDPPPGTVFVDGHDVRRVPLAVLRGAVGFVPQESFLFSDTIRANLALGLPDDHDERAVWASQVARLDADVLGFPAGYDTLVGERGITLSGGQKQRTALARALAADPRILVLDDVLSAVDTHTEEEILRGLRGAVAERTVFIVSHRVSTVRHADLIVVLRDGAIAESGTHAELVGRDGFYAELHRRQLLEEEIEAA
jgi:ATP-binding cassette, subfamily B, multidrug efflux pump